VPHRTLLYACLCAATLAGPTPAAADVFRAGAARVEIVPPFPTQMGGFFDRKATFTGVALPIYARALVCDSDGTRVAVVATDLIGVSRDLVAAARAKIEAETSIPARHVMIAATHTHSAPSGFQSQNHYGGGFNKPLFDFLAERFATAVRDAAGKLRPARLAHGQGEVEHFFRNRQQDNELVVDRRIEVVKILGAEKRDVIAILFGFTGHPVVLGSSNLLLSGEFPGQCALTVEAVLGGVALPLQGACGDVTVHRSGPPHQEVLRLGRIVAGEVIKAAELLRPEASAVTVGALLHEVTLAPRQVPTPEEAAALLEAAKAALEAAEERGVAAPIRSRLRRDINAAETTRNVAVFVKDRPEFIAASTQTSVQAIRLGDTFLAGIPGELFVEYQLEMKQRVRQDFDRHLIVVGYANDYIGYIVTPRAKRTGGYEQAIARVDEHAGRQLTEKAMELVTELFGLGQSGTNNSP
jgi:neutral ceramidase